MRAYLFLLPFLTCPLWAGVDFRPPTDAKSDVRFAVGYCGTAVRNLASIALRTSAPLREMWGLVSDKSGEALGFAANALFDTSTQMRWTGLGTGIRNTLPIQAPYPVERRVVEAFLLTLEVSRGELKLFSPRQHYVLSRVRAHLEQNPDVRESLLTAVQGPQVPLQGKDFVFHGYHRVRAFDFDRDIKTPLPAIRYNGILQARVFEDHYQELQVAVPGPKGTTSYAQLPTLESEKVRFVFHVADKIVGYCDGKYLAAVAPDELRFTYLWSLRGRHLGHVLQLDNGDVVMVPKEGVEIFILSYPAR